MDLNAAIDRNSYIPLYAQVKEAIRDAIDQGQISPGEQLPGEPELCRLFEVSRTVIRQALRDLEMQGLIVREKGIGTFVAEPKLREGLFQQLTGFYQDMSSKGHPPISRVLTQEIIPAGRKIARYLRIRPGDDVVHIDRLRFVDEEPIVLVSTYLPHRMFPTLIDADLERQSLYAWLQSEYGVVIARGRRYLEAVPASDHEAALLEVKKGAPLILLNSVSYLEDGTPLEYYHAVHRGDRSRFEVDLIRVPERATDTSTAAGEMARLAEQADVEKSHR